MLTAALGLIASAAPAVAEEPGAMRQGVLVELFTSQGCSSCPPADALLAGLAARDDVVALALHVDYWDYLGWRDSHGDPRNARRQRAYADRMGERMVYTPQMVVQGARAVVGSDASAVRAAIAALPPSDGAALSLSLRDGAVVAEARSATPATVVAFIYDAPFTQRIGAGENAGDALTYVNAVLDWRVLAEAHVGAGVWTVTPPAGAAGVALVAQQGRAGPVMGAARIALPAAAHAAAAR
jgi:hypothetical protein